MIRAACALCAVALLLAACGEAQSPPAAAEDAEAPTPPPRTVLLNADEAKQLGIMTAPAQSFRHSAQIQGYGTVDSSENVAQIDSEIATAEAAVRASEAAMRRDRALVESGAKARADLEASERQAASDAAQLTLAERKLASTFGQNAPMRTARE